MLEVFGKHGMHSMRRGFDTVHTEGGVSATKPTDAALKAAAAAVCMDAADAML